MKKIKKIFLILAIISLVFINIGFTDTESDTIEIEPGTEQVKKEKIRLITLDKYLNQKYFKNKKIFIKIDTQGYEENIIKE